ncbi:MAG: hypothetical protein Q9166_005089 [cf. Caloplaca sp. 2 TL-2023]
MPNRKRSISRLPVASQGETTGLSDKPVTSPTFRFCDLPGEIRNRIYHFCLIRGDVTYRYHELLQPANQAKHEQSTGLDSNLSLLRVSTQIYAEAVPIFYGLNDFHFTEPECWRDILQFDFHLTGFSHEHLSNVSIDFPKINRHERWSNIGPYRFHPIDTNGLKILKAVPNLQVVTFCVSDDIMTRDVWLLRQVHKGFSRKCRVVFDFRPCTVYTVRRGITETRTVRLSLSVPRRMRTWRCGMLGAWEVVDKHHPLLRENEWAQVLLDEMLLKRRFGTDWRS